MRHAGLPVKVLLDAHWWHEGPAANRTVMREVVDAWARVAPEDELVLAMRRGAPPPVDAPADSTWVHTRLRPHGLSNAIELGRLGKRIGADAILAHNYAPLGGRSVVFIQDLLFEDHPEWFSLPERVYFAPMAWLARRAAAVLTSSMAESSRIERLHPRLRPVGVAGLSVPRALTRAVPAPVDELESLEGFVLSVGRLNIRKNLETALAAAALATTVNAAHPLVVVGSAEHSGVASDLSGPVRDLVNEGTVIFLGRVDDRQLRWLYDTCAAFVFVSRDEGFGLPPVEAAWFGAPTVVSDISVLREVTGGKARYVNPDDAPGIAAAIDDAVRRGRAPDRGSPPDSAPEWDAVAAVLRDAAAIERPGREA